MPDRVKFAVRKIDQARDRIREDDFFKDLEAESLVDIILNKPALAHDVLKDLASAFIKRNQGVLEEGINVGVNLGKEFMR